jgi:starch phosphorylase
MAAHRTGVPIDTDSLFDVLVKRIHEYKRQHLQVLHIVALYRRIKANPSAPVPARTFIFGGKAAPGYHLAKLMIKLITAVGDVVNRDADVRNRLKVVFLPNFNVTNGQRVYPAADLSEQISTAGKEASGTGTMKFAMNGALSIGTLDGANIEIRAEVGAENFFLFGLSAAEVSARRASGYCPMDYYQADQELREVVDLIRSGFFARGDTELFRPLMDGLLYHDPYVNPQYCTIRQVFLGSRHSRVLRRHLACRAGANQIADRGGSARRAYPVRSVNYYSGISRLTLVNTRRAQSHHALSL